MYKRAPLPAIFVLEHENVDLIYQPLKMIVVGTVEMYVTTTIPYICHNYSYICCI